MLYVVASPDLMTAAATNLAEIGSAISTANGAAALPTVEVVAAAADEVSTQIAALFGAHARSYQTLSTQAAAFHSRFVQALTTAAASYASVEAANASPLQVALDVINAPAQTLLGRPLIGNGADGSTPGQAGGPGGFDCSGLVMWAFQQAGIALPHSSQALAHGGQPVALSDLQPGDVLTFYSDASHAGIYIGDGLMVHSSTYGVPVRVVPMDSSGPIYDARRY